MKEGDVILTPLPQSDGRIKNRPAVILRQMPGYNDVLVCGVSSQLHQFVHDFDELIVKKDDDFAISGLIADSVIRLSFLTVLPRRRILGSIGKISHERHKRLLQKLSAYLIQNLDRKQ